MSSTGPILQKARACRLGLALALGPALLVALLLAIGAASPPGDALAQGPAIRYVAPAPIGNDAGNNCNANGAPCATVQHAVDVASPGDEIHVAAGTYTHVHATSGLTQVVYLSKTVTIQGGYATANWSTPYPVTQPTILDAQGQGRVLYITGNISPTIEGFTLTGGAASGDGGGIFIQGSSSVLAHNLITDNQAGAGGGVYMIGSTAAPILDGNRIISNTASHGGGIFIDDYSSPTLINNVIARNYSSSNGSGLYIDFFSKPTLVNNTIAYNNLAPNNWANEGIFMWNTPSPTVTNNIIAGHACAIEGTPLNGVFDYNDVWDCSGNCYCGGVSPGAHDLSVNPYFVEPGADDYHLLCYSPVIDRGSTDGAPLDDFDGQSRPLLHGIDMGADEYPGLRCVLLPVILKNH